MTAVWCATCRSVRERATDVIEVTDRATGAVRYVCRPSTYGGSCFRRGVRTTAFDAIADPAVNPRPAAPASTTTRRSAR